MTNTKTTKKALVASVISILLCATMLVGTTYAWFTDTATTGVNTIVAGNLDIAVYAGSVENGAFVWDTDETDKDTKLFNKDALWEPGYTEVAYIKVVNEGTLALKYTLAAHFANEQPSKNAAGEDIYLSKYLKYDVVELDSTNPAPYATREDARNAAVKSVELTNGAYRMDWNGSLASKEVKYFAVIVYMPTTVGNEANYDADKSNGIAPSIELGINLVATQDTVENDGFGDDYDNGADMPTIEGIPNKPVQEIVNVGTLKDLQDAFKDVTESDTDIVINISKDITLKEGDVWETYAAPVGTKNVTINGNGHTITGLNAPLMTGVFGGSGKITINDLTITGANISYSSAAAGGSNDGCAAFIAYTDNSGALVMDNCMLTDSTINGTQAGTYVGGFIGYSSNESITITGCKVENVTFNSQRDVGGLIGYTTGATTISDTTVKADITSTHEEYRAGAIAGTFNSGSNPVLTNVVITGTTITANATDKKVSDYVGRKYVDITVDTVVDTSRSDY